VAVKPWATLVAVTNSRRFRCGRRLAVSPVCPRWNHSNELSTVPSKDPKLSYPVRSVCVGGFSRPGDLCLGLLELARPSSPRTHRSLDTAVRSRGCWRELGWCQALRSATWPLRACSASAVRVGMSVGFGVGAGVGVVVVGATGSSWRWTSSGRFVRAM